MAVLRMIVALFLLGAVSVPAEGRKLAVVVGVGTYRTEAGLPPLGQAPVNDATRLSAVLRNQGFKVFEMTHAVARQEGQELMAPNCDYIRDQIDRVLGFPNLGADDAILIMFSGHGVQFDLVDDAGEKTPQFYFCPADATIAGIQTANQLTDRHHLLPLTELYEQLGNCRAATKLLIVDACRNDPNQPTLFRAGLASATLPKLPPPPGGTIAFFSCKPNEMAVQDPERGEGIFAKYLIEGLEGKADQPLTNKPADGVITFAELSAYVANNTYAHVLEKYKVKQSPELRGELDLNLPLARISPVAGTNLNMPAPAVRPIPPPAGKQAGEVREFTDLKIKLVWCPPGSFKMGSPTSDTYAYNEEKPQHDVRLPEGFWLGHTEVTQGLWESVMETQPWRGKQFVKEGANYPAVYIRHGLEADESVEQDSATEFCRKLTESERAAGRLPSGWEYRLPSEAQWEYACRAGTTTKYSFGDDVSQLGRYAWYDSNTRDIDEKYAHLVGTKRPNPWGLYDMHGNVKEWCSDWYGTDYYASAPGTDPRGPSGGRYRVYRGGDWDNVTLVCRSARRDGSYPSDRGYGLGFRVCLSPSVK